MATIHTVKVDHHGCAVTRRLTRNPLWRPAKGVSGGDLGGVHSVVACKYEYAGGGLIGSVSLAGPAGAAAIAAVAAAPVGTGPNDPASCTKKWANGDEVIVLEVEADQGTREIALRFGGCDHHGFDDGSTVHQLTRDAVAPFIVGPNRVMAFSGELHDVLAPSK